MIDVQRVYMEPEPMVTSNGDDLIDKCRSLIGKARAAGIPVVFVQHLSDDQPDDPDLEKTLADLGARRLFVCGLATFGCVNATVMCAACKGYEIVVVGDAHGAHGFPDSLAGEVIEHFNRTWERAGAWLVREADAGFR